jgi:RNA polymerase sigma factor (sigma-70 family)
LRLAPSAQYRVMSESDEALLGRSLRDPDAFAELYKRHVDAVVRFAARRAEDPETVVDLVAAVWLEVLGSLERFDPRRGRALPWILGIAANLCASERRRRAREREALRRLGGRRVLHDDDHARLEQKIDAARSAAVLRGALDGLPPSERIVAELVMVEGLTPTEVASALGIAGATVRMRLTRARGKLKPLVDPPTLLVDIEEAPS